MKKLLILSLTVLATSFCALSLAQACNDNQFACESGPGEGSADDCCSCPANEGPDDSDGNGIPDGCIEDLGTEAVKVDACHGHYQATDLSAACDGTLFVCCRTPRDSAGRLVKDPCHGHENFADTCPRDTVFDSCCLGGRKRVVGPK